MITNLLLSTGMVRNFRSKKFSCKIGLRRAREERRHFFNVSFRESDIHSYRSCRTASSVTCDVPAMRIPTRRTQSREEQIKIFLNRIYFTVSCYCAIPSLIFSGAVSCDACKINISSLTWYGIIFFRICTSFFFLFSQKIIYQSL